MNHIFLSEPATTKFWVEADCSKIFTNFLPYWPIMFLTLLENKVAQIYSCLVKSCRLL